MPLGNHTKTRQRCYSLSHSAHGLILIPVRATLPPVLRAGECTASYWYTTAHPHACRSKWLQVRQLVEKLPDGVQQRPGRQRFHPIAQHEITCLFYTCQLLRCH